MAKLNAEGHRWVGQLADFRFDIRYRLGKTNIDADMLSRCPLDIVMEPFQAISHDELIREQRTDIVIGKVMELKENNTTLAFHEERD